jgi:tryptophan halogenase
MNISIVGGGTAGWLTALFIRSLLPASNIVLIQSDVVGIIGVGEATTPSIINFLKNLNIDPLDVVRNTGGSIKNGINFENWNGDSKRYFHGFKDALVDFSIPNIFAGNCSDYHLKSLLHNGLSFEEHIYQTKLSYQNKIDLDHTAWALHFDATRFSNYLQNVGISRNINIVEGSFKNVVLNEQGTITEIFLEDGNCIKSDLVFDCSGFARLLIGNLYKENWISYTKHLPMKKGIAFWLDGAEDIEPYTSSIAMKFGWVWKIPLQERTGSGYIFDSDYINEDQALGEAEKYFGTRLDVRKSIPFEAGRYENVWVKNCIAVGLSSSFIEPLESTSIWNTVVQLETLRNFVNDFKNLNEKSVALYNEIIANNMDEKLRFVYLHYLTKRTDSDFWKNFKSNFPPPQSFEYQLGLIKDNNLRYYDIENTKTPSYFPISSYIQIAEGLGLIENLSNNDGYNNIVPSISEYKELIDRYTRNAISHRTFLDSINTPLQTYKSYIQYTKHSTK